MDTFVHNKRFTDKCVYNNSYNMYFRVCIYQCKYLSVAYAYPQYLVALHSHRTNFALGLDKLVSIIA